MPTHRMMRAMLVDQPHAQLRVFAPHGALTRAGGVEFFRLAQQCPLITQVTLFPLDQANQAPAALREDSFDGAAVLIP